MFSRPNNRCNVEVESAKRSLCGLSRAVTFIFGVGGLCGEDLIHLFPQNGQRFLAARQTKSQSIPKYAWTRMLRKAMICGQGI